MIRIIKRLYLRASLFESLDSGARVSRYLISLSIVSTTAENNKFLRCGASVYEKPNSFIFPSRKSITLSVLDHIDVKISR